MTIDPVTAAAATAAIGKTTSWLWDKYGKDLLDKASKAVMDKAGREGKKLWDERQWKESADKYLKNLYEDVSTLRVLGKMENQPIERMYTDVNVLGELSAERRYKLSQLPEEYEERVGLRWQQKERQDGLKLAHETKRLFILGKPGAGKTTFLKHVALQTIKGNMGEKIPIFISLWDLANSGLALRPYIGKQFRICGFPNAGPFVRKLLEDGRALVLFDGLDEVRVENEQRDKLVAAVEDFGREFRDSQVFITCRLAVTDYTFDGYRYVEMADFDQKQMQTFVFRWFQHNMAQRDACWEALKADHNKTLRELAQIPLLLSLLCLTYEERNEFPRDRDEIYEEATDALLVKWDSKRLIIRGREIIRENAVYENLTLKRKQKLLAHVAAQNFADGQYFIEEDRLAGIIESFLRGVPGLKDKEVDGGEVLRVMEAQHGIFVERARAIHSFSHLTLQEYYAARYIVENEAGGTLPRLMQNVGDERWREVFLLTAGMLSDATDFCHLYLRALQQMVGIGKDLVALLQWGAAKSAQANATAGGPPPAGRAFYIFLALDRDRALTRALALDLARARAARAFDSYRDRVLASDVDRALDLALDLARALDRDRALDRALARALDRARALDDYRGHALDAARYPNGNFYTALVSDRQRVHFLTSDLARALAHAISPLLALDYLLSMFLVGEVMMDWRVAEQSAVQLDQLCHDANLPDLRVALAALPLPGVETSAQELQAFAVQFTEIARTHRDLGHEWKLSGEQVELLEKYLQANLLFVECLNLAYVPDRAAIENQILLPPGMS